MSEGSIKFNCLWEKGQILLAGDIYAQLEDSRTRLHKLGLIGNYRDGIGYGNLSVRNPEGDSFYISGSGTGGMASLEQSDYALVTAYDISENKLTCKGLIKASSESLTHAAVYKALPSAGAVVHVHCLWLWQKLLYNYPATSAGIEYGTPKMAEAVGKLAMEIKDDKIKLIVMGGHQEGILAFGEHLSEVTEHIITIYNRYKND